MGTHLFCTDIDGTLLRGSMPILDTVEAAAKRFAAAGGMIALSTGRSPLSTEWIARELGIEIPCILYSGAVLYDFNGDGVVSGVALPDTIRELLAEVAVRYPGFSIQAYSRDRVYLLQDSELLQAKGVREEIERGISSFADIEGSLFKIVLTCPDIPQLEECGKVFFATDKYHFAFASRHFVEIVAAGADKGAAVRLLAEKLNIPLSNTFAAGDAMTDYSMFKTCAYSFAVADAPKALIEISNHIIPPCQEGGMAEAFDMAAGMVSGR